MKKRYSRIIVIASVFVLMFTNTTTLFALEDTGMGSIYGYHSITRMKVGYYLIDASMFGEPESSTEPSPSVQIIVFGYASDGRNIGGREASGTSRCSVSFGPTDVSDRFAYGRVYSYLEGYDLGSMQVYAS